MYTIYWVSKIDADYLNTVYHGICNNDIFN